MAKMLPITIKTIDAFLGHYIHIKNRTTTLSRSKREHVLKQIETAKEKEWIKEENGKIYKRRFDEKDELKNEVQNLIETE